VVSARTDLCNLKIHKKYILCKKGVASLDRSDHDHGIEFISWDGYNLCRFNDVIASASFSSFTFIRRSRQQFIDPVPGFNSKFILSALS